MTDLPPARTHLHPPFEGETADILRLAYEDRLLRRKRVETVAGHRLLIDLPQTVGLAAGDALGLEDGRLVVIEAAEEPLMAAEGEGLARLAWHIGNRHTPCQIEPGRLVLRHDRVLWAMLEGLGAHLTALTGPFTPEGGAYGAGQVMGHSHGHDHDHDHDHGPADAHDHPHDPSHAG
ncbi:urease accessory protein UreE [Pseudoroseicyclus tamaricis]|uniref:Urease accessory protein UreE n=1 Tax=Pseudoroseicyclus tamaricis TaxID=2705421 RepID=A0A6B2JUF7_9RHOB|nr:urease accessory protein UreE [Pseudoroseicyclus tamaricis]NDU99803.1 urease accessory protein UreE [Pseudoroseicyclus tamaricis]